MTLKMKWPAAPILIAPVLLAGTKLALAVIPDTDTPWSNVAPAPNRPATNAPAAKPAPPANVPGKPVTKPAHAAPAQTAAQLQATLDQLTQTNHELLDLLKKQQGVLEDMQFDRRLQSRQIQSLEERLEEALQEKHQLETKVAKLEMDLTVRPPIPETPPTAPPGTSPPPAQSPAVTAENRPPPAAAVVDTPPAPPASYLPPAGSDGPPGTQSWRRLFVLKGDDNRQTDLFPIRGKTWRVLWHNQDRPGKTYENTSALFINAFPRDDTIPQKVSAKLGSGGDSTVLRGPGNFYLKIEASGGSWELAVEEFR